MGPERAAQGPDEGLIGPLLIKGRARRRVPGVHALQPGQV